MGGESGAGQVGAQQQGWDWGWPAAGASSSEIAVAWETGLWPGASCPAAFVGRGHPVPNTVGLHGPFQATRVPEAIILAK